MAMRGPTAVDLQTTLGRQVDTLARRIKAYTAADWSAPSAREGLSNADVGAGLVATLDLFVQGVELRDKPSRPSFTDRADGQGEAEVRRPARVGEARPARLVAQLDALDE